MGKHSKPAPVTQPEFSGLPPNERPPGTQTTIFAADKPPTENGEDKEPDEIIALKKVNGVFVCIRASGDLESNSDLTALLAQCGTTLDAIQDSDAEVVL